jgi:hypothetical protein
MYTDRSVLMVQPNTLLDYLYTDRCVLAPRKIEASAQGQRWPRPSRLVVAGAEHALGSRPPRQPCVTATESALTMVERLTEHASASKRRLYSHFSGW